MSFSLDTSTHCVYVNVNMNINLSNLQPHDPLQELLQSFIKNKLPSSLPPAPGQITHYRPVFRKRRYTKDELIPRLTADDLVKVNRSILVEALRYQGIVFKVKEMAQLASCDAETIRRKTKDGTLRKVPGIRHIRVHFDVFFAWLRAEKK